MHTEDRLQSDSGIKKLVTAGLAPPHKQPGNEVSGTRGSRAGYYASHSRANGHYNSRDLNERTPVKMTAIKGGCLSVSIDSANWHGSSAVFLLATCQVARSSWKFLGGVTGFILFFCFCLFVWVFVLFLFFAFPSYISGVHHFWVRFLRM